MDLNPGPPVKAVTALPVLQPPEKNRTKDKNRNTSQKTTKTTQHKNHKMRQKHKNK